MASLEDIGERIFADENWWARILLGGLMCLTVVGAPFAFGYLFRYAYQVRGRGDLRLPAWEDWGRQYLFGLMFLGVWALWFLLPLLVAWLVSGLLVMATFGLAGVVAWIPVSLVLLLAPALFVSALMHFQRKKDWSAVLEVDRIWSPVRANWKKLPAGALCLAGVCILGLPVFPFAFFLGFLLIIPYYLVVFIQSEREGIYH